MSKRHGQPGRPGKCQPQHGVEGLVAHGHILASREGSGYCASVSVRSARGGLTARDPALVVGIHMEPFPMPHITSTPSLAPRGQRMVLTTLLAPGPLLDAIDTVARSARRSRNSLLRDAMAAIVAHHQAEVLKPEPDVAAALALDQQQGGGAR